MNNKTLKILITVLAIILIIILVIFFIFYFSDKNNTITKNYTEVEYYQLRLKLETTAKAARVTAQDTKNILTGSLLETSGNPIIQGLNQKSFWIAQEANNKIGITADYLVSPDAVNESIPFIIESFGSNLITLQAYSVVNDQVELIEEVQFGDSNNIESSLSLQELKKNPQFYNFSLNLDKLKDIPPLKAELQKIDKMLWAFYYPWYTKNFNNGTLKDQPEIGNYNSGNKEIITTHVEQAQSAGIDGFISSWWGPNSFSDKNFVKLLEIAEEKNFKVMPYVELTGLDFDEENWQKNPLEEENKIYDWLQYLIKNYRDRPAFIKINNKPIITFFVSFSVPNKAWQNIFTKLENKNLEAFYISDFINTTVSSDTLDTFNGLGSYFPLQITENNFPDPNNENYLETLSGIYQEISPMVRYYPLIADLDELKVFAATVEPGYDDQLIRPDQDNKVRERNEGELYRETFEAALSSDPDWIFILTWNEWWEHTYIEPSELYGDLYLDITKEYSDKWKND